MSTNLDERSESNANESRRRLPAAPALVFFAAWLALLVWQVAEHAVDARRHRDGLRRSGDAGVGILEAAIRSMGRGRRQRPEFLGMVLEGISSAPGIRGAWLTDTEGEAIASTGGDRPLPAPRTFSGTEWSSEGLLVGRRVEIGPCPFDARGRARTDEEMERPTYLFLFLDRTEMDREIARDLTLRGAIVIVAAIAAAGGILVALARAKARRLTTELAVSEERAHRTREWALLGAGLAHETKNPLSIVRGLAQQLVEESSEDPRRAEPAHKIVDEVDRIVARIGEFLRFSRPAEPQPEPIDLRALAQEMASLIGPDLAARKGRIDVDVAPIRIVADREMLRQILLNLLINAARAIPEGGTVRIAAGEAGADGAAIEVADDGEGIPADAIDRVFEPYYTRTPGGTGLGLAIVKRLAEAQGWRVGIESPAGGGARVRITGIERVRDGG
ncbi:MAG: hypothetical protein JXP34_18505 [Planctomycetes bacterium]|nr:hypothetical protein [Planctomycetota bacterium]